MKENKRNKLKTTLQIIMYIFIILSFLRSFLAKASAEEMASNQQEVIEDYISTKLPSFSSNIISSLRENVFPYCQYFGTYEVQNYDYVIINFVSDISVMPVDIHSGWSSPPCQLQVFISNSYGSRGGLVSTSSKSLSNYYGFRLLYHNGTWSLYGVKNYTGSVSNKYGDTYFGGGTLTKYAGTSSGANSSWFNPWDLTWIKTYGYGPVWIASSSDRQYIIYSANNTEPILYTEDERLKFWTVNETNGSHTLVTVLDDFMQGTEGTMLNEYSDVTLTYELNGIESSVVLNSSNSTIRAYGTATTYKIETPFSVFGFDSDTISLKITKCDFSHTYSAYGYSTTDNYKISCDYLAFSKYVPETPSEIPKDSDVGTSLETPEQKADRYYNIRFNDNQEMSFDDFYDVVFPDEYTLYYVIGSNVSTVHDIASYFPVDYPFAYLLDIATDALFSAKIEDYLKNNYLTSYFDCIVFEYIYEDSSSLTRTYWYYTTVSGRLRTTNSILGDIYSEVNKSSYTLGVLYDFLYERLYDWELKSLNYFAELVSFEGEAVAWLSTTDSHIKDGFTRVIGSGGYSLSDIYNLLLNMTPSSSGFNLTEFIDAFHSKMVYLFVPSYDGFEDNVSTAIDDIGILAMPFYTVKYFLDSAKEAEYKETLDITFPSFEYSGTQYWDSYTASFNPSSIFPDDWFEFLQYCNLLFFSLAITLLTYKHIFGDSTDVRSNTL